MEETQQSPLLPPTEEPHMLPLEKLMLKAREGITYLKDTTLWMLYPTLTAVKGRNMESKNAEDNALLLDIAVNIGLAARAVKNNDYLNSAVDRIIVSSVITAVDAGLQPMETQVQP